MHILGKLCNWIRKFLGSFKDGIFKFSFRSRKDFWPCKIISVRPLNESPTPTFFFSYTFLCMHLISVLVTPIKHPKFAHLFPILQQQHAAWISTNEKCLYLTLVYVYIWLYFSFHRLFGSIVLSTSCFVRTNFSTFIRSNLIFSLFNFRRRQHEQKQTDWPHPYTLWQLSSRSFFSDQIKKVKWKSEKKTKKKLKFFLKEARIKEKNLPT